MLRSGRFFINGMEAEPAGHIVTVCANTGQSSVRDRLAHGTLDRTADLAHDMRAAQASMAPRVAPGSAELYENEVAAELRLVAGTAACWLPAADRCGATVTCTGTLPRRYSFGYYHDSTELTEN